MFESGAPISVAVGDVMASVADPWFKGGFTTKTDANVLTGPDQMYLHPDLQLLIQSIAVYGGAIRCFNIKLDALTQPSMTAVSATPLGYVRSFFGPLRQ